MTTQPIHPKEAKEMVPTPTDMLDLLREIRDNTEETARDCARIAAQTQQIVDIQSRILQQQNEHV
jgi:methionine synthase II (cobalamin-independent)